MDEDFALAHQAHTLEMWPLFKEVNMAGKRAFRRAIELFVKNSQICTPSFV
jgi:hypothetical protein